jgi:hypothetical protein
MAGLKRDTKRHAVLLRLFELALVLVRLNQIACFIANANHHSLMRTAKKAGVVCATRRKQALKKSN